jgi:hypothetical protein
MRSHFAQMMRGVGEVMTQMENLHLIARSDLALQAERIAGAAIAKART